MIRKFQNRRKLEVFYWQENVEKTEPAEFWTLPPYYKNGRKILNQSFCSDFETKALLIVTLQFSVENLFFIKKNNFISRVSFYEWICPNEQTSCCRNIGGIGGYICSLAQQLAQSSSPQVIISTPSSDNCLTCSQILAYTSSFFSRKEPKSFWYSSGFFDALDVIFSWIDSWIMFLIYFFFTAFR